MSVRGWSTRAMSTQTRGMLCALWTVLMFCTFTLVSRMGFATALRPIDVAALRLGVAGLLLLPVFWHFGGLAGLRLRDAFALAFLGGAGFALLAYGGLSLAPAAHGAVLIHGTLPLFSALIGHALARSLPGRARACALGLILGGVLAMACDSLLGASAAQLGGDALLLLASLSWSAYGLLVQRLQLRPAHSTAVVSVLSAACYLPVYALLPGKGLAAAGAAEILRQALVQGVLVATVSGFIYSVAVISLGAVRTALYVSAVPCLTLAGGWLLLGEAPGALALAGMAVVTAGMVLAIRAAP